MLQDAKKKKRLRFGLLILLTVVVIGVVIGVMFLVDRCEAEVYLDFGDEYVDGDVKVTLEDMKTSGDGDNIFVFFKITASGAPVDEFELDGAEADASVAQAADRLGIELYDGDVIDGTAWIGFVVEKDNSERSLTFRNAVFRVGMLRAEQ